MLENLDFEHWFDANAAAGVDEDTDTRLQFDIIKTWMQQAFEAGFELAKHNHDKFEV